MIQLWNSEKIQWHWQQIEKKDANYLTEQIRRHRFHLKDINLIADYPEPNLYGNQSDLPEWSMDHSLYWLPKAEHVIHTLMNMGHRQISFKDSANQRIQLVRFINFYNTVKPHKGLNNATPYEILTTYFNQPPL